MLLRYYLDYEYNDISRINYYFDYRDEEYFKDLK